MTSLKRLGQHFNGSSSIDLKYMSYSSEAVMQHTPYISRLLLWVVALAVISLVYWASVAQIDEFTRGDGKVVPSRDVQIVQNLEGGILAKILVQEGELVLPGQPLLQIDDTLFASTYRERQLQIKQLSVRSARLRAEANSTSFEDELKKIGGDIAREFVDEEKQHYVARKNELTTNLQTLNQKVTQRQQELSSVKSDKARLQRSYNLQLRELNLTRPLVADGAVSRVEMLRLERQTNDLLGELQRARLAIPQLLSAYQEAQSRVEGYQQEFISSARGELTETMAELGRINETYGALEDKVKRTIVRSLVKGTVKQLKVKTVGGVIQPGMDLVEIVPMEDSLLVDARVKPSDIAFIYPGQPATVKFTAYDFSIHGGLSAEVINISPDTIVDENGDSFYEIRLKTTGSYHSFDGEGDLPIIPGMTVNVDILTGKKTIMDYLLKPILKTKNLALRER